MSTIIDVVQTIWLDSGFAHLLDIRTVIMLVLACILLYLGIKKQFEPLLLIGIAFGMLLTNLPGAGLYHPELWTGSSQERSATARSCTMAVCWTFCTSA